jgi:hypothetical protein
MALRHRQFAETTIFRAGIYPSGTYALRYDGVGTFDVLRRSGFVLSRSPGRMLIRIVAHRGYGIRLRLFKVDPKDYPRNIRLMLPGYGNARPDQLFYPSFLRILCQYTVVRYANWMHGNTYAVSTVWPRRTTTHAFTQAGRRGVSIEYMIALANVTADRPWFTIPVGATDYWIENFSALLVKGLDPRLRPIIEYGDDVWRTGSPANRYATMASRNVGLHGDSLAWYSERSVRVFQLISQGLAGKPFVRVLSGPLPYGSNADIDRRIFSDAHAARLSDAFSVSAADDKSLRAAADFAQSHGLQVLSYATHFGPAQHAGFPSLHLQPARIPVMQSPVETPHHHRGGRFIPYPPLPGRHS